MNIKNLLLGYITQQELLNYYNVTVDITKLPDNVNGLVFNYNGINLIAINKDLNYYFRKKTLLHELAHIELNQLCQCNKDLFEFYIDKYEDEANNYIKNLKESVL